MKAIVTGALTTAVMLIALADTALAQGYTHPSASSRGGFGHFYSSSYSDNYSSSWGRSTTLGPQGFTRQGYDNESGRSSFSMNASGHSPCGGYSMGRTRNSGFDRSNGFSQGITPQGVFDQRFGTFDQFRNGSQFRNIWGR